MYSLIKYYTFLVLVGTFTTIALLGHFDHTYAVKDDGKREFKERDGDRDRRDFKEKRYKHRDWDRDVRYRSYRYPYYRYYRHDPYYYRYYPYDYDYYYNHPYYYRDGGYVRFGPFGIYWD